MDKFLIIAVTRPDFFPGEAERINNLFALYQDMYIHVRKPFASYGETERLIRQIDPQFHNRLKMHDYFELTNSYNLGGIHLNSRNPKPLPGARSISKSMHSLKELEDCNHFDYVFLSPIFDSISKKGYKSPFILSELEESIKGKNVIALGGVTPDKFPLLKSIGFMGAALLGYFFSNTEKTFI